MKAVKKKTARESDIGQDILHGLRELVETSTVLAQSWEQGVRVPSPLAGRLLDTIAIDPAVWLGTVRRVHHRAG